VSEDCFREELARDWQFFQYPGGKGFLGSPRIVALQPPPRDAWISEALIDHGAPEIIRREGDRDIYIAVENCTAHYKIDCGKDYGPRIFGCHLVHATYRHHELPTRSTPPAPPAGEGGR
jgi:hypothetical protein